MKRTGVTDLSKSLDELQGLDSGSPDDADTLLAREIIHARKVPLRSLRPDQIGRLVVQLDGMPFILDLVFPILEADPLFEGGYYPGDVLSALIRADDTIWRDRPAYKEQLDQLYQRALAMPHDYIDGFLESLGIEAGKPPN